MQIHPGNALFQTVSGSAAQSGSIQNNPPQPQTVQKSAEKQQILQPAPRSSAEIQGGGTVSREIPLQPAQNFPRGSFIDIVV
ncbi:MAG: hypothetical protein CMM52_14970 [Rhodospirillaceae bacterium]|nr:hypothetical protein [Rhodospirillaceae bacterium]|tara:strand:- start:20953 stop:21198 length:246 start_codon:yes stop_codon:yes gene_type:complete